MFAPELKSILDELKQRLSDLYGDRLAELVLYGSQARGDADEDSDIDVLVVLRGDVDPCTELDRASDVVYDLSYQNDTLVTVVFVPESKYILGQGPLIMNAKREGLPL
jgi:predicted nucleotidyltransferase